MTILFIISVMGAFVPSEALIPYRRSPAIGKRVYHACLYVEEGSGKCLILALLRNDSGAFIGENGVYFLAFAQHHVITLNDRYESVGRGS